MCFDYGYLMDEEMNKFGVCFGYFYVGRMKLLVELCGVIYVLECLCVVG